MTAESAMSAPKTRATSLDGAKPLDQHLSNKYVRPIIEPGSFFHRAAWWIRLVLGSNWWLELGATATGVTGLLLLKATDEATADKLLVVFGLAQLVRWLRSAVVRHRQDLAQRARLHAVLARIGSKILCRANAYRITWFRPEPGNHEVVVPFVRYERSEPNSPDPPDPRPHSRVYYPKFVSYTGLAAAFPGHNMVYKCPSFANREQMEEHYVGDLKVPRRLVERVSDYMINVKTIISCGVESPFSASGLLGVLSIDLTAPFDEVFPENDFPEREFRTLVECLADMEATAHLEL